MFSSFSLLTICAAAIGFLSILGTLLVVYRKFRSNPQNFSSSSSSSPSSSSHPSSPLPHNWIHHVFPSFRGTDVRKNFLSHISKEFRSKGINLFIDNGIRRNESIGPELLEAIRGSRVVLVLLSRNYASSRWCLNELVEIIKCREEFGQTVIPIFYEVDPTDVRKQTGGFGKVFSKTCRGKTKDEIQRWNHALTKVAQLGGYHSKHWDNEARMIEDIVARVLNLSAPSNFDRLVGMESHMQKMEPLLRLDSDEVRIVGILGQPGIGKTTIARSLFNLLSQGFQLSIFMDNIKSKYGRPACCDEYSMKLDLQKQFMSQLTNDKDLKIPHLGIVKDRLKDKKVLVVLDDVDWSAQVDAIAKETSWFGPGSRIIITTQDQTVLKASGINHLYSVPSPSYNDALQMFCMYVFGQKSPYVGFEKLAREITTISGESPAGIRFMGFYFRGKSKEEWENELPKLRTSVDGGLRSIIKFTEGLSEVRPKRTFTNQDVKDDVNVSNKLYNSAPSSDFGCLVGIESHMTDMETLLQLKSDEVRRVGILGPPGIGKTTIARSLFNRHSQDFQLSVFMDNIKPEDAKRSVSDLPKQFMSQLTNDMGIMIPHLGVAKDRLKDKKVLVVLDDVDHLLQLEAMANETWFGPGSRIVIITRNQEVLKASGINHLHSVNSMPYNEALQIFCIYAFGQKFPCDGFEKLAQEITTISGELPAGVRFMGSYFRGKSQEEWENELPRLRTSVNGGLRSIIKFTYDALCAEDKKLAHHHMSSLCDELTERIETYSGKVLSQELTITNQDVKEKVNSSERASSGMSSNGLLHTVYIYCADTLQYSFASHLSLAFHRKGIYASVNCNETLNEIEGARGFVVVLSKNYLSSSSCLDKLVSVLQYRRKHIKLVVPVFYGISPSDVAVQEQESDDRIRDWTSALQYLRDLPGIHYREESSDCELVKEIVKDVYEKLFPTQQIGINSRLLEIKELLCKQPWGIRRIGIWGMPGIGKTTLAKAFFDHISGGYEASCFIEHFDKAFHEKGLYRLWDEHFGKILKDITRPSVPGEKINKKRTLVVLDDVQNPLVAESFLREFHWFGPGSLIIVTSRDKRVFRLCQISHVYEVKSLNKNEALRLFSQCAFGKDIEEQNLTELPAEVIDYANGNPLALSFYGGELKGENLSEMNTIFFKLTLCTPNMFHDLLMSSYEKLNDNERDIFLDIACFFKGDDVGYVKQLLEGCDLFPHVGIDVLVEKCLVTISENRVEMHRIIQDFGREINKKETTWIKRGRRLWGPSTIEFLLDDGELEAKGHPKGALVTEDIKAISLDTTNLRFDVRPTAFENMLNLRFLKIYCGNDKNMSGLRLPRGLESLPNGLRLLHWENYPLQSLPQDFDPCHLVQLNMPYSQLHKLWRGTKDLDMLKMARLSHSQHLTKIDDICKAHNIELIDLQGCTKLQSFPATDQLQHLRVVNLSGCSEIRNLQEFSPNIEDLNLQGTAIRQLQISIGDATNLKKLNLAGCSSLVQLPSSIGNASKLEILDLSNCSSLRELPSSIGNATNLESLNLECCSSLVEIPSSIGNAINLQELNLRYCTSLLELPSSFGIATNLKKLYLNGCSSLVQLPSSIGDAPNLEILDLSNCSSLMELPSSIENAANLESLNLEYCSSLVELPSSIGNITKLKTLCLRGCSGLVQLPSSIGNAINLQELDLEYCSSLVALPSSFENATHLKKLYLTGCSSLSPVEEEIVFQEEEEEEGSSSQEEERLRLEMEEIEAKYREEMKEIERKREEAIMERKKKLSPVKKEKKLTRYKDYFEEVSAIGPQ